MVNGLAHDCVNSSSLVMELLQFYTKSLNEMTSTKLNMSKVKTMV